MRELETCPPDLSDAALVWKHAASDLDAVAQQVGRLGEQAACGVPVLRGAAEAFSSEWARWLHDHATSADFVAGSLRSAAQRYEYVEAANAAALARPHPQPGAVPQPTSGPAASGGVS